MSSSIHTCDSNDIYSRSNCTSEYIVSRLYIRVPQECIYPTEVCAQSRFRGNPTRHICHYAYVGLLRYAKCKPRLKHVQTCIADRVEHAVRGRNFSSSA